MGDGGELYHLDHNDIYKILRCVAMQDTGARGGALSKTL